MPKIHNSGKRTGSKVVARKIIFPKSWGEDGKPSRGEDGKYLEDILEPNAYKNVSDEQFKHLKELFPHEIVNVDDMADLQDRQRNDSDVVKNTHANHTPEGHVHSSEVDRIVKDRVAAEMAKLNTDKVDAKEDSRVTPEAPKAKREGRAEFIAQLEAMDKTDIIAYIETKKLAIKFNAKTSAEDLKAALLANFDGEEAA